MKSLIYRINWNIVIILGILTMGVTWINAKGEYDEQYFMFQAIYLTILTLAAIFFLASKMEFPKANPILQKYLILNLGLIIISVIVGYFFKEKSNHISILVGYYFIQLSLWLVSFVLLFIKASIKKSEPAIEEPIENLNNLRRAAHLLVELWDAEYYKISKVEFKDMKCFVDLLIERDYLTVIEDGEEFEIYLSNENRNVLSCKINFEQFSKNFSSMPSSEWVKKLFF